MRDRPLVKKLFFALILVTIIATPILLLATSDDEYEGLIVRSAKLQTLPAETRLALVLDNDGEKRVRITALAPLKRDARTPVDDVELRYNSRGDDRANLRGFDDFEIGAQQRRFVELYRTLDPCDDEAETVRELRVAFEVFGGTQERVLRLPEPVQLPRCT